MRSSRIWGLNLLAVLLLLQLCLYYGNAAAATVPGAQTTVPGAQTTVPGVQATVPGVQTTVPGAQTTVPGGQATVPVADLPPGQRFVEGLGAYRSGDYTRAIEHFQALVDQGHPTGQIYYNLGNACFKADRLGHAIWWYEKALRLTPGDPDLTFNLNHARSLMTDQPESETQPLARVLFFWRYQLANTHIQWLGLGFNLAFWSALMVRRLMGRRLLRSWLLVLALPALLFTATVAYNLYETSYRQRAIVLPAQISVRAGRTPGATELFILHAGTQVRVQTRQGEHLRIAFGRDKIGWVPADLLGLI